MARRVLLFAFLFLSGLVLPAAVGPAAAAERVVRVGVYENQPLVFAAKNGGYDGLAIDVLRRVARSRGWRLEFVPGEWKECLARLEAGKTDLQVAIAWSEERARRFAFSRETLFCNWGRLYVPAGTEIESLLDLAGKRIAVVEGDIHTRALRRLLSAFGVKAELVFVRGYPEVMQAVERRTVDAGLTNRLFGLKNGGKYRVHASPVIFNPIEVRYAAPKGKGRELLAAIDRWLAAEKKKESGPYQEAVSRWLGGEEAAARLPGWVPWLTGGLALIVAAAFFFIAVLRRMVRIRTLALEREKEKLAAERARSEAIIAGLAHGISIQDREFRVMYQNGVHKGIVGSHEGELCYKAYEFRDEVCEGCPVAMAFADGGVHRVERYVEERDLWVEITASPLFAPDGTISAVIELVQDISERKRAEENERRLAEQLRHSQKMEAVGRLAGGVAHDFNNLLTSILGYCELTLAELPPDSPLRENLEIIRSSGNKAASLTRQLLAYSRKQVLASIPLDLNRVVKSMLGILERTLGEDIEIETALARELPPVEGDQSQLEQVIMNLAVNSRDAMPRGGRLLIETGVREFDEAYIERHPAARPGRYVMLAVSDSGEGMAPEVRERIFEPFFTTKEQGRGTGLGLATVYGVVKQHRGFIWVYSEPGHGTTFKVYLPEAGVEKEKERPSRPAELKDMPRGRGETVLVVDDQEDVRRLVADVLDAMGYRPLTAAGGEEALDLLAEEKVDLVISDVVMPRMSGAELAARIREAAPGTGLIFMSGYTDNHVVLRELREEKVPFVHKPLSPRILAVLVRRVLDGERD